MNASPAVALAATPVSEIVFGRNGDTPTTLLLKRVNRHGLIAGATGTGKTVTLQTLAEQCALAGTAVFAVDVKGDLSGIAMAAQVAQPITTTVFWDVFGQNGHPVRTTISEFGPLLISRLLELSEAQQGMLDIVFRVADDEGLLLIDLKDLRAVLNLIVEDKMQIEEKYGLVSTQSVAAIQRALLSLETNGSSFFGEPALNVQDLIAQDATGHGVINLLHASQLMLQPKLYATFLLWLLSELYEDLPEVGDLSQPKLVIFFDEAHLLFSDTPKALLEKVEQVVRLIRSKGVGVYFVTQNPLDIPESVLGQLGNRFQHALRAFTPKDQKAVKVAAETFRANPAFDTETAITQLAVGEALVSTLDATGAPTPVERVKINLPQSRVGAVSMIERKGLMAMSPVAGRYEQVLDRVSAFESLQSQQSAAQPEPVQKSLPQRENAPSPWGNSQQQPRRATQQRQGMGEALAKSVVRAVGSQVGRQIGSQIIRGILGGILRK